MRNFIIYLAIFLCTLASKIAAQETAQTFENKAKEIALKIEKITTEEKQALKELVEAVNLKLEKGTINKQQADEQKMKLATTSANNIESRLSLEEAKLTQLVKDKVEGKLAKSDTVSKHRRKSISIFYGDDPNKKDSIHKEKSERRTTSQFVFAAGFNNLVTNEQVAKSDFRYMGSHFYEWGMTYNTRILKASNLLHFKYGFSVMYNNLRPTERRIFVENNSQTTLQTSGIQLNDSRFKNVNLVVPIHFEFDFSKNQTKDDKPFFKSHDSFRIGLGGFAGVNLKSKQYIEFNDLSDNYVRQISKGNYNTNDFVYGLSTYIGYKATSLYLKYDLNPLFSDNPIKQNNVSLGLRFDFN